MPPSAKRLQRPPGGAHEYASWGWRVGAYLLDSFLLLDYLWPLWDAKNQALHDKVVSSVVLKT